MKAELLQEDFDKGERVIAAWNIDTGKITDDKSSAI